MQWRASFDVSEALAKLEDRQALVPGYREHWRYLFTKEPVSEATRRKVANGSHVRFVSVEDLFA